MESIDDWKTQYQVCLDPTVYEKIKGIARIREMTIEEWVDEALRKAVGDSPEAVEAKLQAIREAGTKNHPAWIVEGMLREFESSRRTG